jgi:hypothetical protein
VTLLLDAIGLLAPAGVDPFTDADVLATAAEIGLLDAPHLRGNAAACGKMTTRMINGACVAVDPATNRAISEAERVARVFDRSGMLQRVLSGVSAGAEPLAPAQV